MHYADDGCNKHKAIIEEEMQLAEDMATAANKDVEKGDYFKNFFAQSLRDSQTFIDDTSQVFGKITQMISGTNEEYIFVVTCNDRTKFCENPSYYAHMGDETKTMNFCSRFFTKNGEIKPTNDREKDCESLTLREAHRSKATVLVHELTHTRYAMLYEEKQVPMQNIGFTALTSMPELSTTRMVLPQVTSWLVVFLIVVASRTRTIRNHFAVMLKARKVFATRSFQRRTPITTRSLLLASTSAISATRRYRYHRSRDHSSHSNQAQSSFQPPLLQSVEYLLLQEVLSQSFRDVVAKTKLYTPGQIVQSTMTSYSTTLGRKL